MIKYCKAERGKGQEKTKNSPRDYSQTGGGFRSNSRFSDGTKRVQLTHFYPFRYKKSTSEKVFFGV